MQELSAKYEPEVTVSCFRISHLTRSDVVVVSFRLSARIVFLTSTWRTKNIRVLADR